MFSHRSQNRHYERSNLIQLRSLKVEFLRPIPNYAVLFEILRCFMSVNWLYPTEESHDTLVEAIVLEQKWQQEFTLEALFAALDGYVEELEVFTENKQGQEELYQVVDHLFEKLAFGGAGLQYLPESSLNNISYCIMHRTGSALSLSTVACYLMNKIGFDAFLAEIDDCFALVVKLSATELFIVDVMSGAVEYIISNDDVRESLVSEVSSFAKKIPDDILLKDILTEQKIACLEEGFLPEALAIVEALMQLLPEDPYERRDRGLVLSQLECEHWAKDDFDYFIKACPNDPMAMFIRMQLEEQGNRIQTIH